MKQAAFPSRRRFHGRRGFTLIEILVATAILLLLVLMVSQIVSMTSKISSAGTKHMDAESQARLVFERLALDFGAMVNRPDVDAYFYSQAQPNASGLNDAMYFYSRSGGYTPSGAAIAIPNALSLVGYLVNNETWELERLGKTLSWDGTAGMPFLAYSYPMTNSPSASALPGSLAVTWPNTVTTQWPGSSADTDFHVIANGVFRLQFCFQMSDGSYSLPGEPYTDPSTQTSMTIVNLRYVTAIVVAIAVLDDRSRKIVTTSQLQAAAKALPNATLTNLAKSPPQLMGDLWNSIVQSSAFTQQTGMPVAAAGQVRIYQRFFYLKQTAP